MGALLEQLTEQFKNQISLLDQGEEERLRLKEEGIAHYKKLLEEDSAFDVIFDVSNGKGDLSVFDMYGLVSVMEAEEFKKVASYYDAYIRSKFLGRPFSVKVLRIDEEEECIYLKPERIVRNNTMNEPLMKEIIAELNKGHFPQLMGQVRYVKDNHAVVDILCKGIPGYIQVEKWSEGYVRDLTKVCRVGDILPFTVMSYQNRVRYDGISFTLSRQNITGDVWKRIPMEYMEKGAVIVLECIDRPVGKNFWWGINDRLQGIEIMCNYTRKLEGHILVGGTYKCIVKQVDIDNHIFRASPFEQLHFSMNSLRKSID